MSENGAETAEIASPVGGSMRELLRLAPGDPVDLASIDPQGKPGLPGSAVTGEPAKEWAAGQVVRIGAELAHQQEMLFASAQSKPQRQGRPEPAGRRESKSAGRREQRQVPAGQDAPGRRVLLVLQAMDCGGKDGTIRRVAGAMNPLGLHIRSFGPPTAEELRHSFLWRIRRALPPPGYFGIFNRSHYEDVLVARVDELVPASTWRARYDEINTFERKLAETGVTVLKVLLHISRNEQRKRLLKRLDDPAKHWKYDPSDVDARRRWDDYQAAYNDALEHCGTEAAPWYVVPADRKWYRDWAVAHLLREAFDELDLGYPPAGFDVARERQRLLEG